MFPKTKNAKILMFLKEIRTPFLGKLCATMFLHYNLNTKGSVEYQFGSFSKTPSPNRYSMFPKTEK